MASTQAPSTSSVKVDRRGKWERYVPVKIDHEDCLSDNRNQETWQKIYAEVGATNEDSRMGIRAAVYVYCCINGTSRVGNYGGVCKTYDGTEFPAAVISRNSGKQIRKFLRANMDESYEFLKETRVMEADSRFVASAGTLGIAPSEAFAMADWMDNCLRFSPAEELAHSKKFVHGTERSRRARDGHTLEHVESAQRRSELVTQGPVAPAAEGAVEF